MLKALEELRSGEVTDVVKRFIIEADRHEEKDLYEEKEIWASMLDRCPQKSAMTIATNTRVEPTPKMLRGKLMHYGLEYLLRGATINEVNSDVRLEYRLSNGWKIVGRPDVITLDDTLIELKYTGLELNRITPKLYEWQTKFYMVTTGVSKGMVLVISEKDFNARVFKYRLSECDIWIMENIATDIVYRAKAYRERGIFLECVPRFAWECSRCPFFDLCHSVNGVGFLDDEQRLV